jgi:nucleotide-binding universal stress UspA family protein
MYNKIVVPLDGSDLAEVVLPHLDNFTQGGQSPEILLVSVTEKIEARVPRGAFDNRPNPGIPGSSASYETAEVPMTIGKLGKSALSYLDGVALSLSQKGFTVCTKVLAGNPAEEIVHYAESQKAEVIMIGSRGKSGFSRWDLGNIAEKVIRATHAVVVLVKPEADFKETKTKRKGVAL